MSVSSSGTALASAGYPFLDQLTGVDTLHGSFSEAESVAVDTVTGDVLVAESQEEAIDVFSASGEYRETWTGTDTPAGSFGEPVEGRAEASPVTVSTNDSTGDVYVTDSAHKVVDVLKSSGGYLCQITGRITPSSSECNGAAGSATPADGFRGPEGITVDQASGAVYVADPGNDAVYAFTSAGAYASQYVETPEGPLGRVHSVAVDGPANDLFVADSSRDVVYEFNTTGSYVATWTGVGTPAGSLGESRIFVAANESSGNIYVADRTDGVIDQFDSLGAYLGQITDTPTGPFGLLAGVNVDQKTGDVYAPDSGYSVIDVFGGNSVLLPAAVTGSAVAVGAHSATLNGSISPEGVPIASCRFEYGISLSYGHTADCEQSLGSLPSTGEDSVSVNITGLRPNTTYDFRLVAENANGPERGANETLGTLSEPLIEGAVATDVTSNSAVLDATIRPMGFETHYSFEYGTNTSYGTSLPIPEGTIAASEVERRVAIHLPELKAGAVYHWRVVAKSTVGATLGRDHTFVYSVGAEALPDGRAYELVSPPYKAGSIIAPDSASIADDGSSLLINSWGGFAGVGNDEYNGQLGAWYGMERTASGWATSPLTPSATSVAPRARVQIVGFSESLWSSPPTGGGGDLFFERGSEGSLSAVGPVWEPSLGESNLVIGLDVIRGAAREPSRGFVYTIQDSAFHWRFDSSVGEESLYEYRGTGNSKPSLVGVRGSEGSTTLISQCGTSLGDQWTGTGSVYNAVSESGEKVFFTALPGAGHASPYRTTTCGTGVGPVTSELYARLDNASTVWVSEPICTRQSPPCQNAGTVSYASPARSEVAAVHYEGASADGSKVFFTTTQQLTNSDTDSSTDLYEYDFGAPTGHNLVQVSVGDGSDPTPGTGARVQGVSRISEDGSRVYFVAEGVLTTNPGPSAKGLGPHGNPVDSDAVAQSGADNMYVFNTVTGQTAFITDLCSGPATSGVTVDEQCPSTLNTTQPGANDLSLWSRGEWDKQRPIDTTPDGQFAVFTSYGDLTADDLSTTRQVFEYDALSGELVRVSIGHDGFDDNGNAGVGAASIVAPEYSDLVPRDARGGVTARTMSDDGSYVFFQSPIGLTRGALNEVPINGEGSFAQNVYEYHDGQVHLISSGTDATVVESGPSASSTGLVGTSASGADVFFTTASPLVPQDTDTQIDVYDARIGGGFAVTAPTAPCEGEGCQGSTGGTPATPGVGSLTPAGGVLAPPIEPNPPPKPKKKTLTRAQKLKRALNACRKKPKKQRAGCEAQAQKAYGAKSKTSKRTRRTR